MSAIVERTGGLRQLDRRHEPPEQITEEQAGDRARLARLLMAILRDVADLRRRWWPRTLDHRDRAVDDTGTTLYRFPHDFGRRVNWWPVRWTGAAAGPSLVEHSTTDNSTLVLVSYEVGTLTLRIEEGG